MAAVLDGKRTIITPFLGWLETGIYKICGIDSAKAMNWKDYLLSLLGFNFLGALVVFLLQVFQHHLPLNPNHLPNVGWATAFNTAISFIGTDSRLSK